MREADLPGLKTNRITRYRNVRRYHFDVARNWALVGRFHDLVNTVKFQANKRRLWRLATATTLEYAWDDYALSQYAGLLGKKEDEQLFLKRSGNYRNVFDRSASSVAVPRTACGFCPSIRRSLITTS